MLQEYEIPLNGIKTTLQLSDEDARARGLDPAKDVKAVAAPAQNKARSAPQRTKTADTAGAGDAGTPADAAAGDGAPGAAVPADAKADGKSS